MAGLPIVCAALALAAPPDEALERWLAAWARGTPIEARSAEAFVERLRRAYAEEPSSRRPGEHLEVVRELALDALALARPPEAQSARGAPEVAIGWAASPAGVLAEGAGELLAGDGGARAWMLSEVLAMPRHHPAARRRAALAWLAERPTDDLATALLVVARQPKDPLRPAALEVLAGWAARVGPDESIDNLLVSLLGSEAGAVADVHPFTLLLERLHTCSAPLGERASSALQARLAPMLLAPDWREASRAIRLARGLDVERRVPLLLDAASAWTRRAASGRGSKRIEGDLFAELERISGRRIGTNPRNWITWWVAVRQGRIELPEEGVAADAGEENRTRAAFFGLRPSTDRVTFVVDHSGSMAQRWQTLAHTRYEEAIEQMIRFLQASGPETKFNVILFDDEPLLSSPDLIDATAHNLERARTASLGRPPDGGTNLRPAIELALELDSRGAPDLATLESDTVVVLCDGETAEGSHWVEPFLQRVGATSQIVFHCVLIGTHGDGTLEKLARLTGGEFIRVGG